MRIAVLFNAAWAPASADAASVETTGRRASQTVEIEVTMNHISGATHADMAREGGISASLLALNTEALNFVPRDKAEALARQ